MSNTRVFRAGRRAKVVSLRDQLRKQDLQLAYQEGVNRALQAQLAATKMERPEDLEEWIASVLPDMSEAEREAFEAMTVAEQERFLDELSQQLNTAKLLLELGD